MEEVEGFGGSKHEALETAGSSRDGRRLWRRPEALDEVEGSEGNTVEALETAGSYRDSRKFWRRSKALEGGLRGSGGG